MADPSRLLRVKIQNQILLFTQSAKFLLVCYDNQSGFLQAVEKQPGTPDSDLKPASALCNEIAKTFDTDRNFGRSHRRRATVWNFQLILNFQQEVSTELFEELFLTVPRVELSAGVYAFLNITRYDVVHPVAKDSAGGSNFVFFIDAVISRA